VAKEFGSPKAHVQVKTAMEVEVNLKESRAKVQFFAFRIDTAGF
jgi:hypothetical protein